MSNIVTELSLAKPVVTDGAWGTQLQMRGLAVGDAPDPWNLDHADLVEQVAAAYVAAGSQVILTNTFGANRVLLERHGLGDKVTEINVAGVEISRRAAAAAGARVFASMGPTGKMLAVGEISAEEAREVYFEQATALRDGGADALLVETMSDLAEAAEAVAAGVAVGLPVVASMTYQRGARGFRTLMGETVAACVKRLTEAGASAVGANCGMGPEQMVAVVNECTAAGSLPVWAKANAGMPRQTAEGTIYDVGAQEFAAQSLLLRDAGAAFIGGCCGSTPAAISAVVAALRG